MENNTPEHIAEKLKIKLTKVDNDENRDLPEIEKAVGICLSALLELREYVNNHDFKTREEEIRFFKVTKAYVLGEYLYYSKLLEIEARHPVGSIKARISVPQEIFKICDKFVINRSQIDVRCFELRFNKFLHILLCCIIMFQCIVRQISW